MGSLGWVVGMAAESWLYEMKWLVQLVQKVGKFEVYVAIIEGVSLIEI